MKMLLYPLIVLVLMSCLSILTSQWLTGSSESIDLTSNNTYSINPQTGEQTLNGTGSTLQQGDTQTAGFDINMTTGIIALIIGLVAVGAVAGIRVLGSGLSDYSVQLIHKAALYYGLWGVFSALAFPAFIAIQVIGLLSWFILTLIYSMGFFQTLNYGGGGSA